MIKFKNQLLTLTLTAFVIGSSAAMAATEPPAPKEEATKSVGGSSNACSACIATFLATYTLLNKTCHETSHSAMPNPGGPDKEKFATCIGYYCMGQVDCWANALTAAINTLTTCSSTCTQ